MRLDLDFLPVKARVWCGEEELRWEIGLIVGKGGGGVEKNRGEEGGWDSEPLENAVAEDSKSLENAVVRNDVGESIFSKLSSSPLEKKSIMINVIIIKKKQQIISSYNKNNQKNKLFKTSEWEFIFNFSKNIWE